MARRPSREGVEALGQDHELLEINRGIRVRAAVDDVGHRDRQHFGVRAAQVLEEGHAQGLGRRFGGGQRDGEDGVGAELGLGFGAVELEHDAVNGQLVERIHAAEGREDFLGDILDRFGDAFAEVTFLVAVAQFEGFVLAGAGARRHRRAPTAPPARKAPRLAVTQQIVLHINWGVGGEDHVRPEVADPASQKPRVLPLGEKSL